MVHYVKLDPTGNTTILVLDPVPREEQACLAECLMKDPRIGGEQVGYLEPARDGRSVARLQMMGGEFCGNATMSTAAYLLREQGIPSGGNGRILLEVSGCDQPVECWVQLAEEEDEGTVTMPGVSEIRETELSYKGTDYDVTVVNLEGITHIITKTPILRDDRAERILRTWAEGIDVDAVGLLQWNDETGFMRPLVLVKQTGTLVWETGCGSGSTAIGCMKALEQGDGVTETRVRQPGGIILVRVERENGQVNRIRMTGRVRLLGKGVFESKPQ